MRIALPTKGNRKLSNRVADTFSRAPHFTIVTIDDNKFKGLKVVNNSGENSDRGAGPLAARLLKENKIDLLLTSELGPGAKNILDALDIEINLVVQGTKVKDLIESYL